jgi:hypothetical protein
MPTTAKEETHNFHLDTHFSHRQCTVLQAFWIAGVMVRCPNMSFGGAYEFAIAW